MAVGEATAQAGVGAKATALRAFLALALGMVCISFTAIFTKWAAVPGTVTAAYRMGVAALVLAIPFLLQYRRRRRLPRAGVGFALLSGFWFALNLSFLNSALLLTSAATATLLDNTAPIWVGLGALLLFREALAPRYWVGLVLALGGAAVVAGFNPLGNVALNRGDVLAFTGAVFYASYLLSTQRARRDLDTLSSLWLAEVAAAVFLFVVNLALNIPLLGYAPRAYLAILAVGLVSQTGGWLLISYALGYLPASTAVVVLLGQPVVTGLLSIPLLGEGLTVPQLAGGTLVLAGIYLCLRPTPASPEASPEHAMPRTG